MPENETPNTPEASLVYKAILTNLGHQKIAALIANEEDHAFEFKQMAVGSNRQEPTPFATGLLEEKYRADLTTVYRPATDPGYVYLEMLLPNDVGGFYIREIGLYDAAGYFVGIASCAEMYKPLLNQGQSSEILIRIIMEVSSEAHVTIIINPSAVLVTRDELLAAIEAHEKKNPGHPAKNISYDHPDHLPRWNVQSALDAFSELLEQLANGYFNFDANDAGKILAVGPGGNGLQLLNSPPVTKSISATLGVLAVQNDLVHVTTGMACKVTALNLRITKGSSAIIRLRFLDWTNNAWREAATAKSISLSGTTPITQANLTGIELSANGYVAVDVTSVSGNPENLGGWLTLEPTE